MIRTLSGVLREAHLGQIILDVNGVGYLLYIQTGAAEGHLLDTPLSLHTYLAVREDALTLYGFFHRDDLSMFEHLINLPKIGPKTALQILSQAPADLIRKSVSSNDPAHLSKLSGLGKKTAEKIVVGLKDVFGNDAYEEHAHATGMGDVIDALIALGYNQKEARDAALRIDPSITDTNARLREALRNLSV